MQKDSPSALGLEKQAPTTTVTRTLPSPTPSSESDDNIVDFDDGDPENPLNWPTSRKWMVVVLVSMMNLLG